MSTQFYKIFRGGFDLDLIEIAAQRNLNEGTLEHFEEWFHQIRDGIINSGRNPTERKLFIQLLKEQPEFKQARQRVRALHTKVKGY